MTIQKKIDLNNEFKKKYFYLEDLIHYKDNYLNLKDCDDINLIYLEEELENLRILSKNIMNNECSNLQKIENEYLFFKNLHRQTKYDNIISLIKIIDRLDLELNILVNLEDIDYDNIWEQINLQIPYPIRIVEFLDKYSVMIDEFNNILKIYFYYGE